MKLPFKSTLASAVVGVSFLVGGTANAVDWKMATPWGGGKFLEEMKRFSEKVKTATEGRVNITVFPAGTFGKALKVTDSVKSGVAQAGHNWMGYDWGIDKTTVIFGGYVGGLNEEEFFLWLYEAGGAKLWEEYRMAKFGVVSMPCGVFPAEVFLHSKKKVTNLEDYKGIKQRTAGAWAEVGGSLGATTVILPGSEVYPALERGVIDATEWSSISINEPVGFHKIAKYLIFPSVHQPGATQECMFNKKAWDSLEAKDQASIKRTAELATFRSWTNYAYQDLFAYRRMEKGGNEFLRLEQSFIDVAQKAGNDWADGVVKKEPDNKNFKKMLNHQRQFQHDMSVYSKMRSAPGSRTAIGEVLK